MSPSGSKYSVATSVRIRSLAVRYFVKYTYQEYNSHMRDILKKK